ncbi:DUF2169 family type VI secretion system accessory protein [Mesorhizobium amorphae]|uniref:DUF2169 family type VI secretion system accessory protein n=1 Tax=Mesorhizobium amorphae TaxID=71433 RepID=UPI00177BCB1C|nr:DUF2169 domain-containing protein [Mesorhizobium amorphae]
MWALNNSTPYKANRAWVRDMDGREVWLVALRGRFLIAEDGSLTLQDQKLQPDVKLAPEFAGEGAAMYLRADSDLPHLKLATDVLVEGHACAPSGHVAERLHVAIQVGPLRKDLVVFGNRAWQGGRPGTPEPFVRMPITWTRAFGGMDAAGKAGPNGPVWYEPNPVGVGFSTSTSALTGTPIPNIEDPRAFISSRSDRPQPAGFGAIAGHWPQRRRYAGTYDKTWEDERLPLLPLDFDPRYHQQAPADQQVPGYLRGGEPVLLQGLHPSGLLRFSLPQISFVMETEFDDLTEMRHDAKLHTVFFEPDLPAVSLVWHSHLECHSRVTQLRETRIWERQRIRATTEMATAK